jgi:hypothetical protein
LILSRHHMLRPVSSELAPTMALSQRFVPFD